MIKKIFHGLFTFFFIVSLLLFLLLGSISLVVGDPQTIKSTIDDSGLYDHAVNTALVTLEQELAKGANEQGNGYIDISQPALQRAAKKALPPETLQDSTEVIIDSYFKWLNGNTDQLEFTVDLTDSKKIFAREVGEYAKQRYAELPECSQSQLAQVQKNPDPLTIPCQTPLLNEDQAINELVKKIKDDEVFSNAVITEEIFENEQGESPFKNTEQVQNAYGFFKIVPWLLLGSMLLFAISLVFLNTNIRRGVKQVASTLTSVGGIFIIGSLILVWAASQTSAEPTQSSHQEAVGNILASFASSMLKTLGQQLLMLSVLVTVIGLMLLAMIRFTKSKQNPTEQPQDTSKIQS